MILELHGEIGADLKDLARDALRVSIMLGITVQFDMNGKTLCVYPESSIQEIIDKYHSN